MTKLKGIKLSLKASNLYLGKLSYRYGNKKLKPRLKGDNLMSLGSSPRDIKINIERSVSGFEGKLVKEEWKSRFISKQLLKSYYDLSEKEYKDLRQKTGLEYSQQLIEHLERRLDVILFRLNWACSLAESHHLVKKGYIYITDKKGEWMEHPVAHSRMYIGVGTLISLTRPIDSAQPYQAEAGPDANRDSEDKEGIVERIIRVKALHNLVFKSTPFHRPTPLSSHSGVSHQGSAGAKHQGGTIKVKSLSHRQTDRNQVSWLKKIDPIPPLRGPMVGQDETKKVRQIRGKNNKLYTSNWEAMLLYNPVFKEILLPIPLDTKKLS